VTLSLSFYASKLSFEDEGILRDSGCMIAASFWPVLTNYEPKTKLRRILANSLKRPSAHLPSSVPLPAPLPPPALLVLV
jgi:hypothetical protein